MDKRQEELEQRLSKETIEKINQKFQKLFEKMQYPEVQRRTTEALDLDNTFNAKNKKAP